jgi:hypothetical protein
MKYYLSYIEAGIHASVMLSVQESDSKPATVVYEAGFVTNITEEGGISLFRKQKGYYLEDEAASKLLYSRIDVKHRTYEISKQEAENFFITINKQKTSTKGEDFSFKFNNRGVSGEYYQVLINNCKGYALSLFNSIGVLDANILKNSFIQITKSTGYLLESLSKDSLSCPVKDSLMREIIEFIDNDLKSILSKKDQLSVQDEELANLLQEKAVYLKNNINKIGVDTDVGVDVEANVEDLFDFYSLSKVSSNLDESARRPLLLKCDNIRKNFENFKAINAKSSPSFLWKNTPKIAPRVNLDNFSEVEKAIYVVSNRKNSVIEGLDYLENSLAAILKDKNLDEKNKNELLQIKILIHDKSQEMIKNVANSGDSSREMNMDEACKYYSAVNKTIDNALDGLKQEIDKLKPHSKLNPIIDFIYGIVNLFKQESTL